jgi:hypothetical protein
MLRGGEVDKQRIYDEIMMATFSPEHDAAPLIGRRAYGGVCKSTY